MGKWIGAGIWLFLGAASVLGVVLMWYKEIRLRTVGETTLAQVVSITPTNGTLVCVIALTDGTVAKEEAPSDEPLETTPSDTPSKLGCVEVIFDPANHSRSGLSTFLYHKRYELVQRRTRLVDIIARTALLGIPGLVAIGAGVSIAKKDHITL